MCVRVSVCACVSACVLACVRAGMRVYVCACVHVRVFACVRGCTCVRACICIAFDDLFGMPWRQSAILCCLPSRTNHVAAESEGLEMGVCPQALAQVGHTSIANAIATQSERLKLTMVVCRHQHVAP